jgi:hypothetical protein
MALYLDLCAECVPCTNDCPTPICDGCLTISQPIVLPSAGIAPCGDTGFVTIKYNGCESTPTFSVLSHDPELTNVSFTDDNLMFESTADAKAGEYYKIRYKATCSDGFEVQGVAHIGITDLCAEVSCSSTQVCDECTGNCVDGCADLAAGNTNAKTTGTNITVQ